MTSINCGGRLLELQQPKVMGILNVTPDSFYDGGRYEQEKAILQQAEKMLTEGANILDIGGMSSRPNAPIIAVKTELKRVIPAIESIVKRFPQALISIDTVQSQVAKAAVEAGAVMVNDISAGSVDSALFQTVADLKVPYIFMHIQGLPQNMQVNPSYQNVVQEVMDFFVEKVAYLNNLGIKDILLDVGFGFGKTVEQNYELLQNLDTFGLFDQPMLVGISRKSMIYKPLNIKPKDALNGTTTLNTIALLKGAKILRVHDVKAAVEAIKLVSYLK